MNILSKIGGWLARLIVPTIPAPSVTPPSERRSPAKPANRQEHLGAGEGAVLVKDEGIAILYPPIGTEPNPQVIDTLDYLRHALERADWMAEWSFIAELEAEEEFEQPGPQLTVLDGGLAAEPREPVLGPFAQRATKDPPSSE